VEVGVEGNRTYKKIYTLFTSCVLLNKKDYKI